MTFYQRFRPESEVTLHKGDSLKFLRELPDESVQLTLTSPPYCMGKEYEGTNRVGDFLKAHQQLMPEICRVTAPGGSICWQVGYHVKGGQITPLDFLIHGIMSAIPNIVLRNRIIWTYGHGLHCSNRFSGRHEMILWYTKDTNTVFNLDKVRVPQKYPGKRHYKGPRKGKYSGNLLGKNPSDVWDIPNVKANHVEKTKHPCQFPVALALRLVKALTNKGDVVLDPFMGSGTTGIAAIIEKRKFIGAEILSKYHSIATKRCREALNGDIKFRSPELSIFVPDPNAAVARRPSLIRRKLIEGQGKGRVHREEHKKKS